MSIYNLPQLAPGELEPAVDLVTVYHQKTGEEMKLQLSALAGNPPSGVSGAIQFSGSSAFASDAANLFWDNTNKRLGVGTNAPSATVDILPPVQTAIATQFDCFRVGYSNSTIGVTNFPAFQVQVATTGTSRFSTTLRLSGGSDTSFAYLKGFDSNTFGVMLNRANSNLGLFSDNGIKLGDTAFAGSEGVASAMVHIKGSGSTSATSSLLVQNSVGTTAMSILDNGVVNVGSMTGSGQLRFTEYLVNGTPFNFSTPSVFSVQGSSAAATSGIRDAFLGNFTFAQSSGTGVMNVFNASPTINQTGGANGITRGLFIDPTLTAAADFRAIETTAGKIVLGGLPTSSAGLVSGQIWNDGGTIKIV